MPFALPLRSFLVHRTSSTPPISILTRILLNLSLSAHSHVPRKSETACFNICPHSSHFQSQTLLCAHQKDHPLHPQFMRVCNYAPLVLIARAVDWTSECLFFLRYFMSRPYPSN
ncbi:hypothetical protein BJ165DRAFT_415079 [Panaeolus papilionaceus]|nr:hypothetical protein BJ165DRAFT_415079 [Panaeolus papilionaceus]